MMQRRFPVAVLLLGGLLLAGAPTVARAQNVCRPASGSAEAQLLRWFSVPLGFQAALPAPSLRPGQVALALELAGVPQPSASIRRSEECFTDKGQNTGLSPVLPRPRLAVGLPGRLTAEVSYLPPVTVADATPNLLGVALARSLYERARSQLALRAHATVGFVEGPITCGRSALQADPLLPCFGTEPSADRFSPNVYGVELLGLRQIGARWTLVSGAGVARLQPRFAVGFRNGLDLLDNTRVVGDFTRLSATVGLSRMLNDRVAVGALVSGLAGDAATVRLTGQWRAR